VEGEVVGLCNGVAVVEAGTEEPAMEVVMVALAGARDEVVAVRFASSSPKSGKRTSASGREQQFVSRKPQHQRRLLFPAAVSHGVRNPRLLVYREELLVYVMLHIQDRTVWLRGRSYHPLPPLPTS
jgi:hypothetical protein